MPNDAGTTCGVRSIRAGSAIVCSRAAVGAMTVSICSLIESERAGSVGIGGSRTSAASRRPVGASTVAAPVTPSWSGNASAMSRRSAQPARM